MTFRAMLAPLLFFAGIVLTLVAADGLWPTVKLYVVGRRTTGKLVRWRQTFYQRFYRSGLEVKKRWFYPVVSFQAADGSMHLAEGSKGYEVKPDWPIGHALAVRFDPSKPSRASVEGTIRPPKVPALILVGGVVLVLGAIYQ